MSKLSPRRPRSPSSRLAPLPKTRAALGSIAALALTIAAGAAQAAPLTVADLAPVHASGWKVSAHG